MQNQVQKKTIRAIVQRLTFNNRTAQFKLQSHDENRH